MWAKLFSGNELLGLPVLSMLLFIAVFVAVVVRVMGKQRRSSFEAASQLPLADDDGAFVQTGTQGAER